MCQAIGRARRAAMTVAVSTLLEAGDSPDQANTETSKLAVSATERVRRRAGLRWRASRQREPSGPAPANPFVAQVATVIVKPRGGLRGEWTAEIVPDRQILASIGT